MIINADLHIHSHFSKSANIDMNIKRISLEAPKKGLDLVATGDCLHPGWIQEIKKCNKIDEGTFELNQTIFILSTEIEDKDNIHHLIYFYDFSKIEEFKHKIRNKSLNVDEVGKGGDGQRLQAAVAGVRLDAGHRARLNFFHSLGNGPDVVGGRAATATDQIHKTTLGKLAHVFSNFRGGLVKATKLVGQAGIGVGRHVDVCNHRQFDDVRAHQLGTEGTIQSDRKRIEMAHRIPKCFRGLAGKSPP